MDEKPEPLTVDRLWTIADVARYLGVCTSTVKRTLRSIPRQRIGGRVRFIPSEVERWVRAQKER